PEVAAEDLALATEEPAPAAAEAEPATAEPEPVTAEAEPVMSEPEPAAPEAVVAEPTPASGAGVLLRLVSERGPTATFEIDRSGATIGRAPENTIRLDDLSVSRKHARVAYRQGAYWLSDLGSMGGTWVDGAKLSAPRRLTIGQVLDIGVFRLAVAFVS